MAKDQKELKEKEYTTRSGNISAKLRITSKTGRYFSEQYEAKFNFSILPVYLDGEEQKVEIQYSASDLKKIFERIKKAEEGVEEIFQAEVPVNTNWKAQRNVMRCILSLEDQLNGIRTPKPLYEGFPLDFENLGRCMSD